MDRPDLDGGELDRHNSVVELSLSLSLLRCGGGALWRG
uniref:Uncharacterized protein n=1 Tax=Arundo donax TaxID=35708 RepID=A0A0A8ZRZ4_ARUDO